MHLAAVKKICVVHEAMNGYKKFKGSLKACFENVNTLLYLNPLSIAVKSCYFKKCFLISIYFNVKLIVLPKILHL